MLKEYPNKIIALRKEERSELIGQSIGNQKNLIRNNPIRLSQISKFKSYGFEELKVLDRIDDTVEHKLEKKRPKSYFQSLDSLGAYIFYSKNDTEREKFKSELANDYNFFPDYKMYLPATQKTELRGNRRTNNPIWPEISGITKAHNLGITGGNILVGVLDTGCDVDHIQFRENDENIDFRYVHPTNTRKLRKVRGFDTDGHGTHVCGIIAGKDIGIAPDVSLKVASVIESENASTSLARILTGLEWISSEYVRQQDNYSAAIINLSLGFPDFMINNNPNLKFLIEELGEALRFLLRELDILSVVAIGNDGEGQMRFPGYIKEVLSVGAIDFNFNPAEFSGGGLINERIEPNVCGFGVDIYSALERTPEGKNVYANKSGTSMAAPYVSGIAALIAQKSGLKGEKLRNYILKNHIHEINTQLPTRVGSGLVIF